MKATAMDSLSDTCATFVVLLATLAGHFFHVQIDGYCGVLVGVFILLAGINAAKETLDPLLGQPPEEAFVQQIAQIVTAHEEVCGIHDLIVHDYGPGRQFISLHAEVPAEENILTMHDVIDNIENELHTKLKCDVTIHMDPVLTEDEQVKELKEAVTAIVRDVDEVLSMHDFRVVAGATHTNLIFDVLAPYQFRLEDEALVEQIGGLVKERIGMNYFVVIKVDKSYVSMQKRG